MDVSKHPLNQPKTELIFLDLTVQIKKFPGPDPFPLALHLVPSTPIPLSTVCA